MYGEMVNLGVAEKPLGSYVLAELGKIGLHEDFGQEQPSQVEVKIPVKKTFVHFDDHEASALAAWSSVPADFGSYSSPPGLTLKHMQGHNGRRPPADSSENSVNRLEAYQRTGSDESDDSWNRCMRPKFVDGVQPQPCGGVYGAEDPAFVNIGAQPWLDPAIIGVSPIPTVLPPYWEMQDAWAPLQCHWGQGLSQAWLDMGKDEMNQREHLMEMPNSARKKMVEKMPFSSLDENMRALDKLLKQDPIIHIEENEDDVCDEDFSDASQKAKRRRARRNKKGRNTGDIEADVADEAATVDHVAPQEPVSKDKVYCEPFGYAHCLQEAIDAGGEPCAEAISKLSGRFPELVNAACKAVEWSTALQSALFAAGPAGARSMFEELRGNIYKALSNRHANWVIRKLIKIDSFEMRGRTTGFIAWLAGLVAKDLVDGKHVAQAARNEFASRTVWDLVNMHYTGAAPMDRGPASELPATPVYLPESDLAPVKEHLSNLVETVLEHVRDFTSHSFANYVVQNILEHGPPVHRTLVYNVLKGEMNKFAHSKHGVHIVEKALVQCSPEERKSLAEELLGDAVTLRKLAECKFGCYVAKALLLSSEFKEEALNGFRMLNIDVLQVPPRAFEVLMHKEMEGVLKGVVELQIAPATDDGSATL